MGTPFEMPRLLAAIVHDALYSLKWRMRALCDKVYKRILEDVKYDKVRIAVEYLGIRLVGHKNWNAVTKDIKQNTKQLIVVKLVRTKKVNQEI